MLVSALRMIGSTEPILLPSELPEAVITRSEAVSTKKLALTCS